MLVLASVEMVSAVVLSVALLASRPITKWRSIVKIWIDGNLKFIDGNLISRVDGNLKLIDGSLISTLTET